jgi:hypothetical protein
MTMGRMACRRKRYLCCELVGMRLIRVGLRCILVRLLRRRRGTMLEMLGRESWLMMRGLRGRFVYG